MKMIVKFRSVSRVAAAVCCLGLVSGCTFVSDADLKKVSGAIGDGITGSEVAGMPRDPQTFGALLASIDGGATTAKLDAADHTLMGEHAFETLNHRADGHIETWRNRLTGHNGTFTVRSSWRTADKIECRRFLAMLYVDDIETRASGTACQMRDGKWTVSG